MYNLGGIYYEMKSNTVLLALCGIVSLLLSRCWNLEKRNMKEMAIGIVCALLAIGSIAYYSYIIQNPKLSIHEGYFFSEHRVNRHILKMEYSFTNEDGLKPVFYLDVFTKKEIFSEDFDSSQKYRIFYEEKTDMIVRVEKIN